MSELGTLTKTRLAELLGVSRGSLYYTSILASKDELLKQEILATLLAHKDYGYRRIADELGVNRKRVQRVMQKFALQQPKKKRKRFSSLPPEVLLPVENLLKHRSPVRVGAVWVADFTQLIYKGRVLYFATVVDYLTREVVGSSIQLTHTKTLVLEALERAVANTGTVPELLHSDQGSEYLCAEVLDYLFEQGITPSFSAKSSPWQNGRQESFFSRFKQELPDLSHYEHLGRPWTKSIPNWFITTRPEFTPVSGCLPAHSSRHSRRAMHRLQARQKCIGKRCLDTLLPDGVGKAVELEGGVVGQHGVGNKAGGDQEGVGG